MVGILIYIRGRLVNSHDTAFLSRIVWEEYLVKMLADVAEWISPSTYGAHDVFMTLADLGNGFLDSTDYFRK